MAWVEFGIEAYISFKDSRNKTSVHTVNVSAADARAYVAAADETARAATDIGVYFAAVDALSLGAPVDRGVRFNVKNDAVVVPTPAQEIFNFDKLSVGWSSGLQNYALTIPARDMSAVTVVARNGDVDMASAGAVQDWILAFLDVAVNDNGDPATQVTYVRVSQ